MLLYLRLSPSYSSHENAVQEVTVVFGFMGTHHKDGSPKVLEVATVRRDYKFGTTTPEITVNWSAWGSRPIAETDQFSNALMEATTFAKMLERGLFNEAALEQMQGRYVMEGPGL